MSVWPEVLNTCSLMMQVGPCRQASCVRMLVGHGKGCAQLQGVYMGSNNNSKVLLLICYLHGPNLHHDVSHPESKFSTMAMQWH